MTQRQQIIIAIAAFLFGVIVLLLASRAALAADIRSGIASTYGYDGLLALPEGPGHKVRVCGPAACIVRVSNDAGPSKAMQRAGRIVDLGASDFNTVCGCHWQTVGLVRVTVEYLTLATVPPTDTTTWHRRAVWFAS